MKKLVSLLAVLTLLGVGAATLTGQEKPKASVTIGDGAVVTSSDGIAIGKDATAKGHPGIAGETAYETVAIGGGAKAQGWRCTAIGAKAQAGVVSATTLGRGTYAWGAHNIAIGRGAYLEKVEKSPELQIQNACGIAGDSLWLGGMFCHKIIDRSGDNYVHEKEDGGDGKQRWDIRTFPPVTYTIHGQDAYDARFDQDPERFKRELYDANKPETWLHREDKDVKGGSLNIAAGRGTGTGDGGSIELQTAPAGAASANRKNPLKPGLRVDTDYTTANGTPMLLWDNQARKLKRVLVGPPDSGGPGLRALVVAN